MKRLIVLCTMVVTLALSTMSGAAQPSSSAVTAENALELLLAGNIRYIHGDLESLEIMSTPTVRQGLATAQHPYAIVLSCSDSRVPPEILFDKGLGEIFVIRVAGNVVAPHELGSIEYAVEHIGSPLIMVLGHERCGAVTAAYDAQVTGSSVPDNIASLVDSIAPAVSTVLAGHPAGTRGEIIEQCIAENVVEVAEQLEVRSEIIRKAVDEKKVKIVRAKYDLDDGKVRLLK